MSTETKEALSYWQEIAKKKYPRLLYLGGDGDGFERWVVMTKCKHQQTRYWRYVLSGSQADAEAILARWKKAGCTYGCTPGLHTIWRLRD